MRADRIPAVRAAGVESFKANVRALSSRAEDLLAQIHDAGQLLPAVYHDVRLPRRHGDGLAAIGDAAHAMSPQLGQGANLALVDAAALADALAANPRLPDALGAYSHARRAHLRYYTLASWALNGVFQHDRPRLAHPRDHLIGPACRVPWGRQIMLETLAGVRTGPFSRLEGDWLTPG